MTTDRNRLKHNGFRFLDYAAITAFAVLLTMLLLLLLLAASLAIDSVLSVLEGMSPVICCLAFLFYVCFKISKCLYGLD